MPTKKKISSKKPKKRNNSVKKLTRRSATPHPALHPELNLRSRWELIDYDYIDKLSETDKAWLNKFTDEYVNANFDRKNLKNNLHKTRELISEIDRSNNNRKTDAMTVAKASGKNVYLEDIKEKDANIKDLLGEITEDLNDTSSDGNKNT